MFEFFFCSVFRSLRRNKNVADGARLSIRLILWCLARLQSNSWPLFQFNDGLLIGGKWDDWITDKKSFLVLCAQHAESSSVSALVFNQVPNTDCSTS
jgi:hypothetical protein